MVLGGTFPTVCKKLMAGARAVCRPPESQPNICSTTQTPLNVLEALTALSSWRGECTEALLSQGMLQKQSSLSLINISLCQTVFNGSPHILAYLHFLYLPRKHILRYVWCYTTEISHSRGKGKEYFACPSPGEITATSLSDLLSWTVNSML